MRNQPRFRFAQHLTQQQAGRVDGRIHPRRIQLGHSIFEDRTNLHEPDDNGDVMTKTMQMMRSIYFLGPLQLEMREVPIPQPGTGEVVVKVEAATTCGTDLKGYKRGHRLFKPPMPFGHEWAGIIVAVGADVARWREGDRVTAANSAPCNNCFYCRRGQQQLCENLDDRFNWGSYAEYFPHPRAHRRAEHALCASACAVCACRHHRAIGLRRAVRSAQQHSVGRHRRHHRPGAQGLMQIQIAKSMGAARVIVIGRSPGRLSLARELGADETFSTNDGDPVAFVKDHTHGRGADITFEAAGSADTWQQAFAMTRPGGTAMMFSGLPGGTQVAFDATRLHYAEVTPRATFHHTPRYVEMAIAMIASGQIEAGKLINGEVPLEQTEDALKRMDRSEVIKLAVVPDLGKQERQ